MATLVYLLGIFQDSTRTKRKKAQTEYKGIDTRVGKRERSTLEWNAGWGPDESINQARTPELNKMPPNAATCSDSRVFLSTAGATRRHWNSHSVSNTVLLKTATVTLYPVSSSRLIIHFISNVFRYDASSTVSPATAPSSPWGFADAVSGAKLLSKIASSAIIQVFFLFKLDVGKKGKRGGQDRVGAGAGQKYSTKRGMFNLRRKKGKEMGV